MAGTTNNTEVQVLDNIFRPYFGTMRQYDVTSLNPETEGPATDVRPERGFSRPSRPFLLGQLNVRSLSSLCSKEETVKLMQNYNYSALCIQEHRITHDTDISFTSLSDIILITASATRNTVGAATGGVGIALRPRAIANFISAKKLSDRIIQVILKGNPKTYILSCYSPTNVSDEQAVEQFYDTLSAAVDAIPSHAFVVIGGDFNARPSGLYTYHINTNRNGHYLYEFAIQHGLLITNTRFQKPKSRLWTHYSPTGYKSQLDYILIKKRWRNSIHDVRAYSSSNPIGSDHRILCARFKLSLRVANRKPLKRLNWNGLSRNPELQNTINDEIYNAWNSSENKDYSNIVRICHEVGTRSLPPKKRANYSVRNDPSVIAQRNNVLAAQQNNVPTQQAILRVTYDLTQDEHFNRILASFESPHNADGWRIIKHIKGSTARTQLIQGKDQKDEWKKYFETLLADVNSNTNIDIPILKIFDTHPEIETDVFTVEELNHALSQMKSGKSPGLDEIGIEVWKLPNLKPILLHFCNETYVGNKPDEWGISSIVPIPKKGDLSLPSNYRGISLSQMSAKAYNRMLLNRITPVLEPILRMNQNGFRKNRSAAGHILALRRIVEECKNYKNELVLLFIDFRKAFDSIQRSHMLRILSAYGIPDEVVRAIGYLYKDTTAVVLTPDGFTDSFEVGAGVLQGDTLAPYIFVIIIDYLLRTTLNDDDGFTLLHRRSRRHPAKQLHDTDFADDICLFANNVAAANHVLHRLEERAATVGLVINAGKTKYMHINASDMNLPITLVNGTSIERVDDFKYLGSYIDTQHDIQHRIGVAWAAANSLSKVWKAPLRRQTKIRVLRATVESVFLYGCESWALTATLKQKVHGTYTRLLRKALDVPWQQHMTNVELYGDIPPVNETIRERRMKLAGHVLRHDEVASIVLLWTPEGGRRRGRPTFTVKDLLLADTGLSSAAELVSVARDRTIWQALI